MHLINAQNMEHIKATCM